MIKYFIFDFDGTLVDSRNVLINVYNQLAEKYKAIQIEHGDFEYLKGLTMMERCKFLNFKLYKFPLAVKDAYESYKRSIKDLGFFNGMRELLDTLNSKGFKIAIISTNSETNIRDFLNRNQINFVNEIICSNKLHGKVKDIKKLLKIHQLKNSEVVYVGDEARDIIASKKNRIKTVWVSWGYDHPNNVLKEQPDFIVHEPHEILNIFGHPNITSCYADNK